MNNFLCVISLSVLENIYFIFTLNLFPNDSVDSAFQRDNLMGIGGLLIFPEIRIAGSRFRFMKRFWSRAKLGGQSIEDKGGEGLIIEIATY